MAPTPNVTEPPRLVWDNGDSGTPRTTVFSGSSGGGGKRVDAETQRYVDKSMDAVKAQNDSRFTDVMSELRGIRERSIGHGELWAAAISAGVSALVLGLGVLAYATSTFKGGLSAAPFAVQAERNASQINVLVKHSSDTDAKLDQVLKAISSIQPQK